MSQPAEFTLRIKFSDTDSTGRVYFTSYVRWIDEAIIEYLRMRGITYSGQGSMSVGGRPAEDAFVIGEYHCRIERSSGYDDRIKLRVGVKEITRRTVVFESTLHDECDDSLIAKGYITYVYINPKMSRSADIPESIAKLIRKSVQQKEGSRL